MHSFRESAAIYRMRKGLGRSPPRTAIAKCSPRHMPVVRAQVGKFCPYGSSHIVEAPKPTGFMGRVAPAGDTSSTQNREIPWSPAGPKNAHLFGREGGTVEALLW